MTQWPGTNINFPELVPGGEVYDQQYEQANQTLMNLLLSGGDIVAAYDPKSNQWTLSLRLNQTTTTTTYAMTATDTVVFCDATGGEFTVTLPPVNKGKVVVVKKTDGGANAVTVAGFGTDTVDGGASVSVTQAKPRLILVSQALVWQSISIN